MVEVDLQPGLSTFCESILPKSYTDPVVYFLPRGLLWLPFHPVVIKLCFEGSYLRSRLELLNGKKKKKKKHVPEFLYDLVPPSLLQGGCKNLHS